MGWAVDNWTSDRYVELKVEENSCRGLVFRPGLVAPFHYFRGIPTLLEFSRHPFLMLSLSWNVGKPIPWLYNY